MRRACKYEIYPNKEQAELIFRTVGCARFVYNNLLDNYKQQLEDGVKPKLIEVYLLKLKLYFLLFQDIFLYINHIQYNLLYLLELTN